MSLGLHTLTAAPRRRTKRVGRGNSSGRGTTAGRGQKGQRARTGGSKGLQARALKSIVLRLPKRGGFRSLQPKAATITLTMLAKHFKAGSTVTPESVRKAGLAAARQPVKIVSTGTIAHAVAVKGCGVSAGAVELIKKAGGSVA